MSHFVSQLSDLDDLCSKSSEVGQCTPTLMLKLKHSRNKTRSRGEFVEDRKLEKCRHAAGQKLQMAPYSQLFILIS